MVTLAVVAMVAGLLVGLLMPAGGGVQRGVRRRGDLGRPPKTALPRGSAVRKP